MLVDLRAWEIRWRVVMTPRAGRLRGCVLGSKYCQGGSDARTLKIGCQRSGVDAEEAIDLLCVLLVPARPDRPEVRLAHGFRGGQPWYAPG